jgi:hexosaminidase
MYTTVRRQIAMDAGRKVSCVKSVSLSKFLASAMLVLLLPCASRAQVSPAKDGFVNGLLPQPAHLETSAGQFVLTEQFRASVSGFHDARLDAAIRRTLQQLRRRTGMPLADEAVNAGAGGQLTISVAGPGEAVQSIAEDESYTLSVSPVTVHLEASTVVGAMRGLQTLLQLVQPAGGSFGLPAVEIHDAPRFRWRGLMVDCGRHFEPVDELKRTLDAMAAVKLNVFHWHLTEDQGFRIESKIFPKLTAAGSDGLFYTQEQAAEIVRYARDRGIRVVPEFEMPGHSTAWLVAYPELSSGRVPTGIRREFGISDVALDPTREETYQFIERFLGEMATIFPDPYVHIGGDETVAPDWKTDPRIQAFMRAHDLKDSDALQAYFNQRVLAILTRLHKHMVGWDEILNPALPHDVVVQSWRGEESLVKGAQQGYQGILSAGYYLDGMQPAGTLYLVDPLPSTASLSQEQRSLILGGEICMFGEQLNELGIDSRIWPRSAAIAERFWSPENVRDVDDMYRRLDSISVELEGLGLRHLTHEGAALRELAGTERIDDLRVFASGIEPVSFHERYDQQKTSQLTVLDRFVDAVRPDPPSRFEAERSTREFLSAPHADSPAKQWLVAYFLALKGSVPGVQAQMKQSPLLMDVDVRARQLPGLADAAEQAIGFLSSGAKAPAGWKKAALAMIEEARKPSAIVRFTFIDPLQDLVNAVPE